MHLFEVQLLHVVFSVQSWPCRIFRNSYVLESPLVVQTCMPIVALMTILAVGVQASSFDDVPDNTLSRRLILRVRALKLRLDEERPLHVRVWRLGVQMLFGVLMRSRSLLCRESNLRST